STEYLFWTTRHMPLPPLVTASPAGTPVGAAGALGLPTTAILYGGKNVDEDFRSGFRLRAGFWLDDCQSCGLEGSYFFLAPAAERRLCTGAGPPLLARPFFELFDPVPGAARATPLASAAPVSLPNQLSGAVRVHTRTELYGFDANVRKNLVCGCDLRVDAL